MMGKEGYKKVRIRAQKYLIPKDWDCKQLKEYCKIEYGKDQSDVENENGEYPILGTGGLIGFSNDCLYDKPSVLIGRKGTIDKPQYIDKPFWTIDTLFYTKLSNDTEPKWLYYYLNYFDLSLLNEATGVPSLNRKNLYNLKTPLPPLPEQKKIAEILSTVDEAIEKTDEVIEKTKKLKKGLMQKLLTEGIGHQKFKKVRVGVKKTKIPIEWEKKSMNEMSADEKYSLVDGPFGSNLTTEDYNENGEVRLIQLQNIEEFRFNNKVKKYTNLEKFKEQIRSSAKIGDIVLAKMPDPIGRACIVPDFEEKYLVVADVIKFTPNDNYDNLFAMYYFNSKIFRDQVESYATGSTRLRLNLSNFKDLDVLVPPLKEQKKIASILSSVDEKIEKEKEYKEKLERLKKGLMQKLLTGEVRVNTDDIEVDKEA